MLITLWAMAAVPGLFDKRLDPFRRALAGVRAWDVEAVHQSRVGSRRLRELIPLLGLDPDTQRSVGRQLRRVTRRLGKLREVDVLAAIVDELRRGEGATDAIDRLADSIADETRRTRDWLTRRLPARDLERLSKTLTEVAHELGARDGKSSPRASRGPRIWLSALDARVARRASRLASAIDRAGTMYSPDALHDVRIAVKKLRYSLEVAHEARGDDDPVTIAFLKEAQNLLGRLNDLEMLVRRVRDLQNGDESGLLADFTTLERRVELECRELHSRFVHDRTRLAALADVLARSASTSPAAGKRVAGGTRR
jgi:CHAD domain-containing protein